MLNYKTIKKIKNYIVNNIEVIIIFLIFLTNATLYNEKSKYLYLALSIFILIGSWIYICKNVKDIKNIIIQNKFLHWITLVFLMYEFYGIARPVYGNFNWDYLLFLYANVITSVFLFLNIKSNLQKKSFLDISKFFIIGICLYLLINEFSNILQGGIRIGESASGNVNTVGTYLTFFSVPIFYEIFYKKQKKLIPIAILEIIFVLLTGSKKALLLTGVLLITLYIIKKGVKVKNMIFIILTILVTSILLIKIPFFHDIIGFRIVDALGTFGFNIEGAHYSYSTSVRIKMYSAVPSLFIKHPFIGGGWGFFQTFSGFNVYSHANYIEILITFGLIGFVLYYSFFTKLVIEMFKLIKSKKEIVPFCYILMLFINDFLVITFCQIPLCYFILFLIYNFINKEDKGDLYAK